MPTYATKTQVAPDKTVSEIRATLRNFGATSTLFGEVGDEAAMVQFEMKGRRIRFVIQFPDLDDFAFTPTGKMRSHQVQKAEHAQATRARWRALGLVIKAKLVAVEEGVVSFEEEFFGHFVLPSDRTVYEEAAPHLPAIEAGNLGPMLPALTQGSSR